MIPIVSSRYTRPFFLPDDRKCLGQAHQNRASRFTRRADARFLIALETNVCAIEDNVLACRGNRTTNLYKRFQSRSILCRKRYGSIEHRLRFLNLPLFGDVPNWDDMKAAVILGDGEHLCAIGGIVLTQHFSKRLGCQSLTNLQGGICRQGFKEIKPYLVI